MNLMMLLEMAASGFGDRVAFQNGEATLSFQQLFEAAGGAARRISDSGCERVALLDVNSLALPVAVFGSAWAGIPFSPLNYRLTGSELEALAERIAPSFLISDAARVEELAGLPGAALVGRGDFWPRPRRRLAPKTIGAWTGTPSRSCCLPAAPPARRRPQ